ncbi:hypothetical protein NXX40_05585 [Parabacteroides distasonis]|nr:hypothetical protein [Parabacteroides distasonis]
MVKDTINKNRAKYGLAPIRNFGYHAGERSYNYLLFSQHLGNIDPDLDVQMVDRRLLLQ